MSQFIDELEPAKTSVVVPACGEQHDSDKPSLPRWTLAQANREGRKKVFISNKHKQDFLCTHSPEGGFIYNPKPQKGQQSFSFGTAVARPALARAKYPEPAGEAPPDSGALKYPRSRSATLGTSTRLARYNAPDLPANHTNSCSPGPQRYTVNPETSGHRLPWAPGLDHSSPKFTIRARTKLVEAKSQTGRVGPGEYDVPEACGEQLTSDKVTNPLFSVNKSERWRAKREKNSGRFWDGQGEMAVKYSRCIQAGPSFSFGSETRGTKKKQGFLLTPADQGPSREMAPLTRSCPQLPYRKDVVRFGPTGAPPPA